MFGYLFGIRYKLSFGLSTLHPGKVFFGWRNHIAVIGGNGREDAGWKSGHGESDEAIALVFPLLKKQFASTTLLETSIWLLKMIFPFPRWDMLVPRRVLLMRSWEWFADVWGRVPPTKHLLSDTAVHVSSGVHRCSTVVFFAGTCIKFS